MVPTLSRAVQDEAGVELLDDVVDAAVELVDDVLLDDELPDESDDELVLDVPADELAVLELLDELLPGPRLSVL